MPANKLPVKCTGLDLASGSRKKRRLSSISHAIPINTAKAIKSNETKTKKKAMLQRCAHNRNRIHSHAFLRVADTGTAMLGALGDLGDVGTVGGETASVPLFHWWNMG